MGIGRPAFKRRFAQPKYAAAIATLLVVTLAGGPAIAQSGAVATEKALPLVIQLSGRGASYSTLQSDITIMNANAVAVNSVDISCDVLGPSGSMVQRYNFSLSMPIPANAQKIVKNHSFGYWPTQAVSVQCVGNGVVR
jgi:hypothetical protein